MKPRKAVYYDKDRVCTEIVFIDEKHPVKFKNFTDDNLSRAFGIEKNVDWDYLQYFLESRCFPKERKNTGDILRLLGVPYYDPELIIEKTHGEMAEDFQWLSISEISMEEYDSFEEETFDDRELD